MMETEGRYVCPYCGSTYMEAREGDGLVMNRPTKARGTVQKKRVPTLTTGSGCGTGVVDRGLRIRYLTPRECWRLMGFPDSAYEAARDVPTSKTQLYKQAGNSIVVPCLEAIFKAIYSARLSGAPAIIQQGLLFGGRQAYSGAGRIVLYHPG